MIKKEIFYLCKNEFGSVTINFKQSLNVFKINTAIQFLITQKLKFKKYLKEKKTNCRKLIF